MKPPKSASPDSAPAPVMTVQEVTEIFPEEWVLMRLDREPRDAFITKRQGIVLCHSPSHKKVSALRTRLMKERRDDGSTLFMFDAYPFITSGAEVRQLLAELKEKGLPRDARR